MIFRNQHLEVIAKTTFGICPNSLSTVYINQNGISGFYIFSASVREPNINLSVQFSVRGDLYFKKTYLTALPIYGIYVTKLFDLGTLITNIATLGAK